jgi:hypothetical protein
MSKSLADIVQLIKDGTEQGSNLADKLYKQINIILDERVATHKARFAEEGTTDFDAIKFCIATHFTRENIDHDMTAALLIAAIYRLARHQDK